ncbi:DUF2975 domain-containing protein [Nocardiopsis mangrovi]|uniref:DUF2975 domain-containing protein n=1 Tax=Nocardiopsis mangrovi TaxID=1179818 RepID=A0ABV9DNV5_9ACTN
MNDMSMEVRMTADQRAASWLDRLGGIVRLSAIAFATALALLLISGIGTVLGIGTPLRDHVIAIPLGAEELRAAPGALPPGTEPHGTTEVVVNDPTPAQAALWLVLAATPVALWLAGAVLLHRTIRAARHEGPFTHGVARRLRALGMLAVLGGLGTGVLDLGAGAALTSLVLGDGGFHASADVPFGVVLAGLGMLAIAEIVRHGVDLREDAEGTI